MNPAPFRITPDDKRALPFARALTARSRGGQVTVQLRGGQVATFKLLRWQVLPVIAERVLRKGTTARGIVGFP